MSIADTHGEQIEALKQAIAALEAQRAVLGGAVVSAAVAPLWEKLAELEAQQQAADVERQRKQLTVVFVDVVGSTELVSAMDPEEAMDVFDSAMARLGRVVEDQGGRVTRYMGDGLLAVFGVPAAREDDPQRAVRAGLEIAQEARAVGAALAIESFAVRVGVNTGLVAVGGETEAEDTLMGSAVNLAARLQSAAPVGGVLISHETYRHVRGVFDIQEIEPVVAKGFTEPVRAYHVLRVKARAFRQPLRGVEGLETRMVGREAELTALRDAFLNAMESGEGQVITVSGEAGVGKSRLLEEFQDWLELRPERVRLYQGRGRVEGQALPFGLLREVFADRFQIREDDSPEAVREKLVDGLEQGWVEQAEMKAHVLGQLLGYDFRHSEHLRGVEQGQQLHSRGMMYLGEYFLAICQQRPVVMLLEDIHWADDSTLDTVNWLEERMGRLRLLIVCAGRGALYERRPYWGEGEARHTRVALKPLTKRESRELVDEILRYVPRLPDDLRELVVENAEGNPFYLEELIKMLIEDGVIVKGETTWGVAPERLQRTAVPTTLTGVLQARLDGLPPGERRVLQEASVVGRQFWDRVVSYLDAGGLAEPTTGLLRERLSSLRGRELIFRREASAFAEAREYLFKHDLLREVTYESVLRKVRQKHHALVADWLIANAGGRISEYAGLIGEHLVLGGRGDEAIGYLLQAGEAALAAYSSREAERFYRQALALKVSDDQRATALQGLGRALYNLGRREEAVQVLGQAIDLARTLGDTDRLAQAFYQLSWVQWRGELQSASEAWATCRELVRELEGAPDSPGFARLLGEVGRSAYFARLPVETIAEYARRAMEMAERLGLVDVKLDAMISLGLASLDVDESMRVFEQVAAQAEAHGLLSIASRAHLDLASAKLSHDDFSGAVESRRRSFELDRRVGHIPRVLFSLHALIGDYLIAGMVREVPTLLAESLEAINAPESRTIDIRQEVTARLLYHEGRWAEAGNLRRAELDEARQRGDLATILQRGGWIVDSCFEAFDMTGEGDLVEAEATQRECLQIIRENPTSGMAVFYILGLGQAMTYRGQLDEARRLLAEAEQIVAHTPVPGITSRDVVDYGDQARYTLARAEGHWDAALAIAESFVGRYARGGARWLHARWLIRVGDALRGRDGPGDRARARQAYEEALDRFTAMGADGYVAALQRRLARAS
ncbi:MAG: AAA family ATPase [Myxococcaceae bacterium]|nr:AAA family ATPase [Myxococcaceae bacterium]